MEHAAVKTEPPRLTLFGTSGCHLCEEAEQVLRLASAPAWQRVDIAGDEDLLVRYGTRIPVVRNETSRRELGWPFETDELRALLSLPADPQPLCGLNSF